MRMRIGSWVTGALVLGLAVAAARADDEKVPLDKVPAAVLKAVKDRFPKAEVEEASKETEDGKTIYEVVLEQDDRDITVSLKDDGAILEVEKEIDVKDLPAAVVAALMAKYPKGELEDAEEVTEGANVGYEVVVELEGKPSRKVAVDKSGKITEDEEAEAENEEAEEWSTAFGAVESELGPTGRNPYFILEPGYRLEYEGREGGQPATLTITVLDQTKAVGQVTTRVVEERETKGGQVVEVSRNFFAICKRTNNVYYFGEEVDIYKNGKVVEHEGAWLAGEGGAKFGLAMPGSPLLGARYYQEIAPRKAMDRAEVVSLKATLATPAGTFKNVLKIEETTPLEPGEEEAKFYAAGVGLIQDGGLKLVRSGFAAKAK